MLKRVVRWEVQILFCVGLLPTHEQFNGSILLQNKRKRLIKEAILIRKEGAHILNRDDGNYFMPRIYDQLLVTTATPTSSFNIKQKTRGGDWSVNLRKWPDWSRNCHCRYVLFYQKLDLLLRTFSNNIKQSNTYVEGGPKSIKLYFQSYEKKSLSSKD